MTANINTDYSEWKKPTPCDEDDYLYEDDDSDAHDDDYMRREYRMEQED